MSKFTAFLKDESGAAAAEYVLILAVVGAAIATAAGLLGTTIASKINSVATMIAGLTIG